MNRSATLAIVALAALAGSALPARARAETFDTCTGLISSLPATITLPGVYCLDRTLTTAIASGTAITVNANDVTIDCNGYKLGNLGAGTTTTAIGIKASQRRFVHVRNCAVRGFYTGIQLSGDIGANARSSGHTVEDNLIEASTANGIFVQGEHSVIRRNQLIDIGMHATAAPAAITVRGSVDVLDNTIDGVATPSGNSSPAWAIYVQSDRGPVIARNTIRSVLPNSSVGWGTLVSAGVATSSVHDNVYVAANTSPSIWWLRCSSALDAKSRRNVAQGWPAFEDTNCLDDQSEDVVNP